MLKLLARFQIAYLRIIMMEDKDFEVLEAKVKKDKKKINLCSCSMQSDHTAI